MTAGSVTLGQMKKEIKETNNENYYGQLPLPHDVQIEKSVRFGSNNDDVVEMQKLIRQNVFDHKNFNVFIDSVFGRALLEGLCEPEVDTKTTVSVFIRENGTYPIAVKTSKQYD